LVELSSWLDLRAGSFMFTGKSDNGEFDARSMINGGGAGRRYRPSANAEIAIAAMVVSDHATPFLPSRRAQSLQKLRLCQTRQPFRFSCAPHSAQKLGWCIVGGTPVLRCALKVRYYIQLSLGGIASSRADPLFLLLACYLAECATTLAFRVRKYFKWKIMENRKSKRTFSFAKNILACRYERFLRWASCHLGENESQHRLRLGGSVGRLA